MNMPVYINITTTECQEFLQWLIDSHNILFETRGINLIQVVNEIWNRNKRFVYFFNSIYIIHTLLLIAYLYDRENRPVTILLVTSLLMILIEFFQMKKNKLEYIWPINSNYIELPLSLLTIIFVVQTYMVDKDYQNPLVWIIVLLAYIKMI